MWSHDPTSRNMILSLGIDDHISLHTDDDFVPVTLNLKFLKQAVAQNEFQKMTSRDDDNPTQFLTDPKEVKKFSEVIYSIMINKQIAKKQHCSKKMISFKESKNGVYNPANEILIDSGTNIHVTSEHLLELINKRFSTIENIAGFNNKTSTVLYQADAKVILFTDKGDKTIVIKNLYVVEDSMSTLLLVTELMNQGIGFLFEPGEVPIMTLPDGAKIELEIDHNRLIRLNWKQVKDLQKPIEHVCFLDKKLSISTKPTQCNQGQLKKFRVVENMYVFHDMFGHIDFRTCHKMLENNDVDVKLRLTTYTPQCDICDRNKATRKAVSKEKTTMIDAYEIGEKFVIDLKGDLEPDPFGHKYWLLFTCTVSQYQFFFLLKNKTNIVAAMKKVCSAMKNLDIRVRCFQSDSGGEFTSDEVERNHRTIIEGSRCMIDSAGLKDFLWSFAGEVVERTPYFMMFKYNGSLNHCYKFGTLGWMLVHGAKSLDRHASQVMFVGISDTSSNAIICLDTATGKLRVVYHADFLNQPPKEKQVQFQEISSSNELLHDNDLYSEKIPSKDSKLLLLHDVQGIPSPTELTQSPGESKRKRDVISPSSLTPRESTITIPVRTAPVGTAIEYTDELKIFLKQAFSENLRIICQQRNPKLKGSASRARYELSKNSPNINGFISTGSTWADFLHAYLRGYIQFEPLSVPIVYTNPNLGAVASFAQSFDYNSDITTYKDLKAFGLKAEIKKDILCMNSFQNNALFPINCTSLPSQIFKKTVKHKDTLTGPLASMWRESEKLEWTKNLLPSLKKVTYDEFRSTPNAKKVSGLWVHTQKTIANDINVIATPDNTSVKSRYAANGSSQRPGLDYDNTYAGVFSMTTLRLFLAIATQRGLPIDAFDFQAAYLQQPLDRQNLFMSSPPEINDRDEQNRLTLWLILDGLYGLKQSGNLLYLRVIDSLTAKGFVKLISDPSAYTRYNGEHMELLLVYVDDLFFMSPSPMSRDQFKVDLQTDFKLNENKSQSSHEFSVEIPVY